MHLPSNVASRTDLHHCSCGEIFSLPVWHCPTAGCDHHWPMARDYCANCNAEKPRNDEDGGLPALVDRAASALSGARDAAEVLEARELAGLAYDAAKRAGRLARAKDAHDTLIAAAYRAQADALEIESEAKRRLADEYDAAQERGEAARGRPKSVGDDDTFQATATDLGLRRDQIHEARTFRDAERADPGITRRTLNEHVERGEEPTKAALRKAVVEAARQGYRPNGNSNKNPIYETPTQAGKAWTHLYGTCRALSEWATDENIALAVRGRSERRDDQSRNVAAVRRALEALTEIEGMIDG